MMTVFWLDIQWQGDDFHPAAVGCAWIAGPACLTSLRVALDLTDAKPTFVKRPNERKAKMKTHWKRIAVDG